MRLVTAWAVAFGICALALACAPSRATAAETEPLPPCPALRVALETPIDSATAKVGDVFRFRTLDTVWLPEGPRVPAGRPGYGLVAGVVSAGAHGKTGALVLEARYLKLADGTRLDVSLGTGATESHGANAGVPSVVSAVPIPGIGIAAGAFNYFTPGKNIQIPVASRFEVIPVGRLEDLKQHCAR